MVRRNVTTRAVLLVGCVALLSACDGRGGDAAARADAIDDRSGRVAADARPPRDAPMPPMPPSGTPMAHMDMADAMSEAGGGMRSGLCAVGPASMADAPTRETGRRVVLVVDAAAASRPVQVTVVVAGAPRAGLSAAWVVPGRPRTACAGDDLMITHAGAVDVSARLELASRDSVTVLARTADGRLLAGPLRVGPEAPPVVLRWGVAGQPLGARVDGAEVGTARSLATLAAVQAGATALRAWTP
jgi:hypothetical protein